MSDKVQLEIIVDDKGSLVIKNFKDVVNKSMGEVSTQAAGAGSSMSNLWKSLALGNLVADGVRSAYSAFVGVLKSSVGEYMRVEEGNAALRQTLINMGDATEGTFDALDKYAKQIQATTVVDDDMAKSMMQLGLNMGIPIKNIGGATEAAIGLTKAFKGMSLDQAMKATAAAFEGNTQKLQRYIPELKETATDSEKLALVQKAMADGLKIAHNEITTGSGKLKQWRNDWGDVKESIGKVLVEAVMPLAAGFKEFFDQNKELIVGFVQSLVTGLQSIVAATEWVIGALGKLLGFIQKLSPLIDGIVTGWRNLLVLFTNELGSTYDKLGESIVREAEQEKKSIDRFREAAAAAGIQGEEIRKLSEKYKDFEDIGVKHERMLRDLIKTHPELADKLKATAIAGAGVSTSINDLSSAFKIAIPKVKEMTEAEKQQKKAAEEAAAVVEKYGLNIDGFNEAGRKMYFELMQLVGILPRFSSETQAAADEQKRLGLDTGDLTEAGRELYLQLMQLGGYIPELNDDTKEAAAATEDWYEGAQDLIAALDRLGLSLNSLIPGLGDIVSGFLGAYEACKKLADAQKAGTANFGSYLGAIGAVVGAIKAMADAAKAYNEHQQREFIKGMNEAIEITDEMAEKIRLLAKEMYSFNLNDWMKNPMQEGNKEWNAFHAATSETFADIINSTKLTTKTFDDFARRTHEILSDFDRGMMTAEETAAALGSAFSALMEQAKRLGTEGGAELISMFEDLAARGMRVKEVMDYIAASLAAGLAGYKAMKDAMDLGDLPQRYKDLADSMKNMDAGSAQYKAAAKELQNLKNQIDNAKAAQAAFGGLNIKVFEEMLAYEKACEKQRGLVNAIDAATAALIGLSNAQRLTEQQFDDFSKAAATAYQKLIDGGMTADQANKAMAPMLQRLLMLHEQFGFTFDANTQKLMDQGIASGTLFENQKTENQQIIDLLGLIADLLGRKIPSSFDAMSESAQRNFDKARDAARGFYDETYRGGQGVPIPKPEGPGQEFAAEGWHGWVAARSYREFVTGEEDEPEYVSITPLSKMGSGFRGPRAGSDAVPAGDQPLASGGNQGRTTNNTFHLYNVTNADNVLDIISEGISSNRRSIRSKLEAI